jgi:hypothetical protein
VGHSSLEAEADVREDYGMDNTQGHSASIDADAKAVAACIAAGKPIPDDIAVRVRCRADEARRQLLAQHGVQDIGVQIIREIRF